VTYLLSWVFPMPGIDMDKMVFEGQMYRPLASALVQEHLFSGSFVTWLFFYYSFFDREYYSGTFFCFVYFLATCKPRPNLSQL
jgi:hypothetical protein